MSTIFRRIKYSRTLYTKVNGTNYEIGDVIILKDRKEWIRKEAYDVFDGGIDLGIEVTRRIKVDTGLKNKDKLFITKTENQSTWNDNTVYDIYIDNELLEFKEVKKELYNIQTTIGTKTRYHSDKLDIEFATFEWHESETMNELKNAIIQWKEIEQTYVSFLSTLDEVETYTEGLLNAKKEIDNLIEKARNEVLSTL